MYKTILVPLDGSPRAERILPHVEALAEKFGARLLLLQVVEPILVGVSPYDAGALFVSEEIERRSQEAKDYLAGRQAELTKKNMTTETVVEYGPIVSTLLEQA